MTFFNEVLVLSEYMRQIRIPRARNCSSLTATCLQNLADIVFSDFDIDIDIDALDTPIAPLYWSFLANVVEQGLVKSSHHAPTFTRESRQSAYTSCSQLHQFKIRKPAFATPKPFLSKPKGIRTSFSYNLPLDTMPSVIWSTASFTSVGWDLVHLC